MASFRPRRVLLTGGAGFIGSALVRHVLRRDAVERLVVLDALTYAGHRENLEGVGVDGPSKLVFVQGDICDRDLVARLFAEHAFDSVLHLAAESHVDRSILSADAFVRTNVTGTFTLIDVARLHWAGGEEKARFVHVSTDEVYGSLGSTGCFTESTPYAPNSPYAASKAAADLLVRAYHRTHGFPAIVTNTCNNYGPRQLPEKLLPVTITRASASKSLPVYGEGKQIREWLHVDDHCEGLWRALTLGTVGESYNLGSGEETSNLELVQWVADLVDRELGRPEGTSRNRIEYVPDRKGHDFRYAIDAAKARRELGWAPTRTLARDLVETVRWYLANDAWTKAVVTEALQP